MKVLDPTGERVPAVVALSPRPSSLSGLRVGLLDITKARGDVFLDSLAELLAARGAVVARYAGSTSE